jgi:carboxylesterase type B
MINSLIIILFCLFLSNSVFCDEELTEGPIIETKNGKVQGFEYLLKDGKIANIFLGIPFAEPPLKKLRFEKPIAPKKWKNTLQATTFKPACIPIARFQAEQEKSSEDCLYLNIFAPQSPSPNPDGYPVLFFIHGGGFIGGSAKFHGYEALTNHFVSQGIIVVTIQYRLGPLGFMAWGDDFFPGNYGLWDMKAALKFISSNVKEFGGNPKRITLWGQSAGAAAVSAMTLSKETRDLFAQAIQNSGSSLGEWAVTNRVIQASEELGKEIGCDIKDSKKFKDCMKEKKIDEIWDATANVGPTREDITQFKFQPRLDADFFTNDLPQLIKEAPKKPTMTGLALEEGLTWVINPQYPNGLLPDEFETFGEERFIEFVKSQVALEKMFPTKFKEVQNKIIKFYLQQNNPPSKKDYVFYLRKYAQLFSDIRYNLPVINEMRLKVSADWKIYNYLTAYINRNAFPKEIPIKKPLHGYEYPYIFNITSIPIGKKFDFDDDDREFTRILIETMVAFIKNGNPSTDDIDWQPASGDNNLRYLEIKPFSPEMKAPIFGDRLQFWALLTKHYEFDIIRGIHKESLHSKDEL